MKKDFQLPSINEVNKQYPIALDTVETAYNILKKQGYIMSRFGKGHFITGKKEGRLKVLLVFNKLSSFKRIVYDNIVQALGTNVKKDLPIHLITPACWMKSKKAALDIIIIM